MSEELADLISLASQESDEPAVLIALDVLLGRLSRAEDAVGIIESLEELPEEDWFGFDDVPLEGMDIGPAPELRSSPDVPIFSDLDANSSPEALDFDALEPVEAVPAQVEAIAPSASSEAPRMLFEAWELEDAQRSDSAVTLHMPQLIPTEEAAPAQPPAPVQARQTNTSRRVDRTLGASLFEEEDDDPFLDAARPLEARSQPDLEQVEQAPPDYSFFDALSSRPGAPGDFLPDLDPVDASPEEDEPELLAELGGQGSTRQGEGDRSLDELLSRERVDGSASAEIAIDSLFDELDLGFLPKLNSPPKATSAPVQAPPAPALDLLGPPSAETPDFEWGGDALFPAIPVHTPGSFEEQSSPGSHSKGPRWLTQPPAAMAPADDEDFGSMTRVPGLMGGPSAAPHNENPPTVEHAYETAASGDDFDFDLGPSRPVSQPAAMSVPAVPVAPVAPAASAEDDFDFELGPSRPSYQVAPSAAAPLKPPAPKPAAPEDDFDFDLGFHMPQSSFQPPAQPEHSSSSSIRLTPDSPKPALSSFERQKTPPSGSAPTVSEDEFFALAESLASRATPVAPTPTARPYRGEPVVRRGEPIMPGAPEQQRPPSVKQPNPFAHDAPTGVRKSFVEPAEVAGAGSHASFVLEEIEPADERDSTSQIRKLYESGQILQAWSRVETVALQEPGNTDVRQLRVKIEQEMERIQLRRLGPLTRTPRLSVAPGALSSLNLDHRSGFLLSQIDGTMSFEDILDLSSMSRLETLMVLADLLEKQVIKA